MSTKPTATDQAAASTAQVLTFGIDGQEYCIELAYVTEILDGGKMTPIPNTAEHIVGVMDLRGRTTTIVNPLVLLDSDRLNPDELLADGGQVDDRIIMLDPSLVDGDGAVGWLVSTVSEVTEIPVETVEAEGITDAAMFRGVAKREDEGGFLIWLDPRELTA